MDAYTDSPTSQRQASNRQCKQAMWAYNIFLMYYKYYGRSKVHHRNAFRPRSTAGYIHEYSNKKDTRYLASITGHLTQLNNYAF